MCRPSRQRSQNEEATKRKDPFSRTSQYRTPFGWVVKDAPKQAVPVRVSLTHALLSRQAPGDWGGAGSAQRSGFSGVLGIQGSGAGIPRSEVRVPSRSDLNPEPGTL